MRSRRAVTFTAQWKPNGYTTMTRTKTVASRAGEPLLAAQQAETRRLSEQVGSLTGAIDGKGSHGGGDDVMLTEIFGEFFAPMDPNKPDIGFAPPDQLSFALS